MKSNVAFRYTPSFDTDVHTIVETEVEILKPEQFEEHDETDGLAPARGVMVAVMLSAPFWAAVIWWLI